MENQSRYFQGAFACTALVLGLSGCGFFWDPNFSQDSSSSGATYQSVRSGLRGKVVESNQAPVELNLPRGWQAPAPRTLHNSADLDAYNPDREIFLVVVGEDRSQVQFNQLTENASEYRRLLVRGFSNVPEESRTNLDRIDGGYPAVQYEIRGKVGDQSVVFLHTTAEVGNRYYQIVVWTPADRYDDNAEAMRGIIQNLTFNQA